MINSITGETLAFLKWREKLQSNENQEFSWVWRKSTLNVAEWTWKRPRQFLIIMKPHPVTENYCEYSVKTIINKQSWYLPEKYAWRSCITTHCHSHNIDKHYAMLWIASCIYFLNFEWNDLFWYGTFNNAMMERDRMMMKDDQSLFCI